MDLTGRNSFYTASSQIMGYLAMQGKMAQMSLLKTEREYFRFLWGFPEVHELLSMEALPTTKSDSEALKVKEAGNSLYKKGDLTGALQMYTRAMIYASSEKQGKNNENLLAICSANRSAVLCQQGRFQQAVVDIEYSLEAGYPNEMVYKLYERKAKCLVGCKKMGEAINYYNMAIDMLKEANLDEEKTKNISKTLQTEISKCQKFLTGKKENNLQEDKCTKEMLKKRKQSLPQITGVENKNIASASESVGVSYAPSVGRHCVAQSKISIGDVVIAEKPFVAVLKSDCLATHCYHCFCRLELPFPCKTCSSALFCSPSCSQQAQDSYHKNECSNMKYFENSGAGIIGALTYRLAITAGSENMILSSSAETVPNEIDTTNINYNYICDLVTNADSRTPQEMIQYAILAVFIVKLLLQIDNWFPDSGKDTEAIGSMILHNVLNISSNGIEINEYVFKAKQPKTLGLGLFPVVSLLNHSCDPSCELVFYGNSCAVYSLKELKSGKEISIDYGYVYYLSDKASRQLALQSHYKFKCMCVACTNDWPTKSKIPNQIIPLICSKCGNNLPRATKNTQEEIICQNCDKATNYVKTLLVLKAADSKPKQTLSDHVRFLQLLQRFVCQPNRMYATALWDMRKVFQTIGNSYNE